MRQKSIQNVESWEGELSGRGKTLEFQKEPHYAVAFQRAYLSFQIELRRQNMSKRKLGDSFHVEIFNGLFCRYSCQLRQQHKTFLTWSTRQPILKVSILLNGMGREKKFGEAKENTDLILKKLSQSANIGILLQRTFLVSSALSLPFWNLL